MKNEGERERKRQTESIRESEREKRWGDERVGWKEKARKRHQKREEKEKTSGDRCW